MLSAIYASAVEGISEALRVSPLVATIPQATYLLDEYSGVLTISLV
jgi:hypothetical protein